jgi:DNA repair protein RecN (Recombination protein N)
MILELRIENFAIIEKLELDFSGSLIVFTGETGAGKSIIIDAVETLLGARSDPTMVRSGAERAYVEATFSIPPNQQAAIHALLKSEELLEDEQAVSLGREIRQNGRSTARVNGRTANLALLRQLGEYLVDVHGQSEHLSLLRVHQHLGLLDSFAGTEPQLSVYTETYRRLQTCGRTC